MHLKRFLFHFLRRNTTRIVTLFIFVVTLYFSLSFFRHAWQISSSKSNFLLGEYLVQRKQAIIQLPFIFWNVSRPVQPTNSTNVLDVLRNANRPVQPPNYTNVTVTTVENDYNVTYNLVIRDRAFDFDRSVTVATQATLKFLHKVVPLAQAWDGPISVAVFAPGSDFNLAKESILQLRRCIPAVKDTVSFHIFTLRKHKHMNYESDIKSFFAHCKLEPEPIKTYMEKYRIRYPVAKARNIARRGTASFYVLTLDLEFVPNRPDVMSSFINMVEKDKQEGFRSNDKKKVYAIPIFESLGSDSQMPWNRTMLRKQIKNGSTIVFHQHRCFACHRIPDFERWLTLPDNFHSLNVWQVSDWTKYWEPVHIGDINEPMYDDRFHWDDLRDNIHQIYELCLAGYKFHILDNVWLIHRSDALTGRMQGIKTNLKLFNEVIRNINTRYPNVSTERKKFCKKKT